MEIIEIQYALTPVWSLIVLILSELGKILYEKLNPGPKDNIAILGTQGAGKTTLWYKIIQKDLQATATHEFAPEKIPETTVEINGIKRTICQNLDISGSKSMVAEKYKELVEKNEYIIFIFDVKRFLDEPQEVEDVKKRLTVINDYIEKEKKFQLIGSHIDELTNDSKKRKDFLGKVMKKFGKDFFKKLDNCKDKSIILMDLTNKTEVESYICETLFSQYTYK